MKKTFTLLPYLWQLMDKEDDELCWWERVLKPIPLLVFSTIFLAAAIDCLALYLHIIGE